MADPASLQTGRAGRPIEMAMAFGLIEIGNVIARFLLQATAQQSFVDAFRFAAAGGKRRGGGGGRE